MNRRIGMLIGAAMFVACGAASAEQSMPTDMDVVVVTAKSPERELADQIVATAVETVCGDMDIAPAAVVIDSPAVEIALPAAAAAPGANSAPASIG